jgi:hypothetical protein
MMASAGIGSAVYAERAMQVADVSQRCVTLTKDATAPLAAWSERCAALSSRYSSLVDELCHQEELLGHAQPGMFCGDRKLKRQ